MHTHLNLKMHMYSHAVMRMLDWQYVILSIEYIIIYVHMQLVIYLCTCVEFIMNE